MAITTVSSHVVSVNAIQGTLIADNAITAVHIATNAVSGTLIADNAVTAVHVAQNSITVTQLADDCVESDKIADGVITTNHLNKAMISSQTEVTPVAGDFVLLGDTSDSNNLKKAPLTLLLNSNVDLSTKAPLANPTLTGSLTVEPTAATGLSYAADGTNSFINFEANSVAASVQLYAGQSSGGYFSIGTKNSSGTLAEKMRITPTGNVGIGTGSPSGTKKLHVYSGNSGASDYGVPGLAIENDTNVSLQFMGGASHQLGITFSDSGAAEAGYIYYNTGTQDLTLKVEDDVVFKSGTTETMRIDSSGRLGVGCTPTGFTAEIQANSGGNALKLRGRNAAENAGWLAWTDYAGNVEAAMYATANQLIFANTTSYTTTMTIDGSGNVFIPGDMTLGSSSSNPGQLFLNDGGSSAYTLGIIGTGTRAFEIKGSDSDADYNTTFSNHANGNHNLIVDGSITSTTNAALALDLAGTHSNGNYMRFAKGGSVQHYIGSSDSVGGGSGYYDYYSIANIGQRFWTGASERMRIFSTGEVHITSAGEAIAPTIKHGGGVGDYAKLRIINRSGQGADKGGILELGAVTNDGVTRSDVFAALHGGKDNATSGNKAGYLGFHTSNGSSLDYRMRLTSNGELLMGDTALRGSVQRGQIQVTQISNSNAAGISCISGNNEIAGTFCLYSSGTASAMISVDPDQNRASSNFYIHIDGAQKAILDSAGNFTITGSYGSSDRALKENIITLPSQLETVKQLNPVSFDWKEKAEDGSTESSIGFIAQEVEALYPKLVKTPTVDPDAEEANTTQYKSLNYAVMTSILTKAIQEQQTVIESLTTRLDNAGL